MEDYLLFRPLINAVIREIINIHNKLLWGHLVPPFLKTGNKKMLRRYKMYLRNI